MRSQGTLINIITASAIRNQLISKLAGTYMGSHGIGADLGTASVVGEAFVFIGNAYVVVKASFVRQAPIRWPSPAAALARSTEGACARNLVTSLPTFDACVCDATVTGCRCQQKDEKQPLPH